MKIETVVVGELETNCYVITKSNHVLIIDPGDDEKNILEKVGNKRVDGVIITHHHFDHVGALEEVLKVANCKSYDFSNLKEGENTIGEFTFKVIYTPGHKDDSICLYFKDEKILFSGDFLFKDTIGRWDLEGGSLDELKESIIKISRYPDDLILYPGHGDKTTLGAEKNNFGKYLKFF